MYKGMDNGNIYTQIDLEESNINHSTSTIHQFMKAKRIEHLRSKQTLQLIPESEIEKKHLTLNIQEGDSETEQISHIT